MPMNILLYNMYIIVKCPLCTFYYDTKKFTLESELDRLMNDTNYFLMDLNFKSVNKVDNHPELYQTLKSSFRKKMY